MSSISSPWFSMRKHGLRRFLRRSQTARRTGRVPLQFERLESRQVLTVIHWAGPLSARANPTPNLSGDWDVASNWLEGVVPGANDDAVLGTSLSSTNAVVPYTVTHSKSTAIDSVHSVDMSDGASLSVGAGVLTIGAGTSHFNQVQVLSSGDLQLRNSTVVPASAAFAQFHQPGLSVTNGTLESQGTVQIAVPVTTHAGFNTILDIEANPSAPLSPVQLTVLQGLRNEGTLRIVPSKSNQTKLNVVQGVLVNAPTGIIDLPVNLNLTQGSSLASMIITGQVNNQGVIVLQSPPKNAPPLVTNYLQIDSPTSNPALINTGAIHIRTSAVVIVDGPVVNRGTIDGQTIQVNGDLNNSGTIRTVGAGANGNLINTGTMKGTSLSVQGGTLATLPGSVLSYNRLSLSGVAATLAGSYTVAPGNFLDVSNTTLTIQGLLTNQGTIDTGANDTSVLSSTINAPVINSGTIIDLGGQRLEAGINTGPDSLIFSRGLTTRPGSSVVLENTHLTIAGQAQFVNTAPLSLTSSTFTLAFPGNASFINGSTIDSKNSTIELTGTGSSLLNQAVLNLSGSTVTVPGVAGLTNLATLNLGSRNTLNGAVDNRATLNNTDAGNTISGVLTNEAGASLLLSFGTGATTSGLAVKGGIANHGTITLGAANSVLPATLSVGQSGLATDGTLSGVGTIAGNVTNAGQVRPGLAGSPNRVLSVLGNFIQTPTGTLAVNLAGTTARTQYDQLKIGGQAKLGGSLKVAVAKTYTPRTGDSYQFLTFGSSASDFSSRTGFSLLGSQTLVEDLRPTSFSLHIVEDVTPSLTVSLGAMQTNLKTRVVTQRVTLTNTSSRAIPGTISLVLDGLPPAVNLLAANGNTGQIGRLGSPYMTVLGSGASLLPGQSVSITLNFAVPFTQPFTYTTRVLAGDGPR